LKGRAFNVRTDRAAKAMLSKFAIATPITALCSCLVAQPRGQGLPPIGSQLDVPQATSQIDREQSRLSLLPGSPFFMAPSSFLQWGNITARPHVSAGIVYGTQLQTQGGTKTDSLVEQFSAGSLFQLGSKWTVDYTAALSFFSARNLKDSLGQNVSLSGATAYGDWTFGLAQSYSTSSQPLIETGRQTDTEQFQTSLSAGYHFNSKWMLDLGVSQSIRSADQFTSSRSWSTMDWLNYQIAPRISVGAGLGGGYEDVNRGSDMTYEQFQARLNMRIAQKLNVALNGGGEVRQIIGSGGDPLVNPIYGASMVYSPFQLTTVSLSANRAVTASLLQGQITESTDISLAVSQRLLGLFYLTLGGGYRNTQYILSNSSLALNRQDDGASFSARLSYGFIKGGTISIFFNQNDNTSTATAFGFSSAQIGGNIAYSF
jgi:hypothetical protein